MILMMMKRTTMTDNEEIKTWNLGYSSALIQNIDTFARLRDSLPGPIGMTSGGYDPIHPGHISSIEHAERILWTKRQYSDSRPKLVVVVNGESFLKAKKTIPFMDLKTRCQIVAGIRRVSYVIPFEAEDGDLTVIRAIELIRPDYFFKGGDRNGVGSIPEWGICKTNGVQIITNVGSDKCWASSSFLAGYVENIRKISG
jgi:cytidyltransferase-like protein